MPTPPASNSTAEYLYGVLVCIHLSNGFTTQAVHVLRHVAHAGATRLSIAKSIFYSWLNDLPTDTLKPYTASPPRLTTHARAPLSNTAVCIRRLLTILLCSTVQNAHGYAHGYQKKHQRNAREGQRPAQKGASSSVEWKGGSESSETATSRILHFKSAEYKSPNDPHSTYQLDCSSSCTLCRTFTTVRSICVDPFDHLKEFELAIVGHRVYLVSYTVPLPKAPTFQKRDYLTWLIYFRAKSRAHFLALK